MNSSVTKILSYGIIAVVVVVMLVGLINRNLDLLFYMVYGLAILGVAGVVFGFVFNSITNPQSLIKSGGSILVLGTLFAIAYYGMATNETYTKPFPEIGAGLSQFIGGMLFLTLLLFIAAFLSIIAAWVIRLVR
jgi:hypothetical protein